MNKNLIITAFCDINGMKSGMNVRNDSNRKDVYYKNAVVSLLSFKETNKEATSQCHRQAI